ncbi:nitric oxide reductase large subunit [Kroppenstedtia sanguinis]
MKKWSKTILITIIPTILIVTALWAFSQADPLPEQMVATDSSNPGAG